MKEGSDSSKILFEEEEANKVDKESEDSDNEEES